MHPDAFDVIPYEVCRAILSLLIRASFINTPFLYFELLYRISKEIGKSWAPVHLGMFIEVLLSLYSAFWIAIFNHP